MQKFLLKYLTAHLIIKEFENKTDLMYPTEQFLPQKTIRSLRFENVKGANNRSLVLTPAAIGSEPNVRQRKSFSLGEEKLFYFNDKMVVDTELLMELKNLESLPVEDPKIVSIIKDIYNDKFRLMEAARSTHEMLRCTFLQNGGFTAGQNGANYTIDYALDATQKETLITKWDDPAADIMGDLQRHKDLAADRANGSEPNVMMLSKTLMAYFKANTAIIANIKALANITGDIILTNKTVLDFMEGQLNLKFLFNDYIYTDDDGAVLRFWDKKKVSMWDSTRNIGETLTSFTPLSLLIGATGGTYTVESMDGGAFYVKSELVDKPSINQETTVDTTVAISANSGVNSLQIITVLA